LVVVASFPRSGTHLLIDLILNNFPAYRRRPLYVNLDEYLREGMDVEELIRAGGYVLKTHYPEATFSASNAEAYERIFAEAIILKPSRGDQAIFASFRGMVGPKRQATLEADLLAFRDYWGQKVLQRFHFDSLVDPAQTRVIVEELEKILGCPRAARLCPPPNKRSRYTVYFRKLATRLLGNRLAQVNTTVGFRRSPNTESLAETRPDTVAIKP
jgi:hypothetical protein